MREGFEAIQSHRTAAVSAPLMIEWIFRTGDAAIGLQACGTHLLLAQSWSPADLCLIDGQPSQRVRHRRSSLYNVSSVRAFSLSIATAPTAGMMVRSMYPT